MKKTIAALITIVLLAGTTAFGAAAVSASSESSAQNVHLVSPTSVAVNGNKVYVSDNVTENTGLIHEFDVSDGKSELVGTIDAFSQRAIRRLRCYFGKLYVIFDDCYAEYDINSKNSVYVERAVKDVAVRETAPDEYGDVKEIVCRLYNDKLTFVTPNGAELNIIPALTDAKSLVASGTRLYCLYSDKLQEYKDGSAIGETTVASNSAGIVCTADGSCIFSESAVNLGGGKKIELGGNKTIKDVAAENSDMYILTNENKVSKFVKTDGDYAEAADFAIGSDLVNYDVPAFSAFTTFTLAKSKLYPANIVYKTKEANSVSSLIMLDETPDKTYVILGYDKDSECDYYYVLVDESFGWIKKSAATPETDNALTVINTAFNQSGVKYEAYLASPNASYVYFLPVSASHLNAADGFRKEVVSQTASEKTKVELLQSFTAKDGTKWYFVAYGENKKGFVLSSSVIAGSVVSTGNTSVTPASTGKINAGLTDKAGLFLTSALSSEEYVSDRNGKQLKLATGTVVEILEKKDGASFVAIIDPSDSALRYYGWLKDSYVIDVNALTTNAIVGLSLVGAAVLTAIICLSVFGTRKNRKVSEPIELDEQ